MTWTLWCRRRSNRWRHRGGRWGSSPKQIVPRDPQSRVNWQPCCALSGAFWSRLSANQNISKAPASARRTVPPKEWSVRLHAAAQTSCRINQSGQRSFIRREIVSQSTIQLQDDELAHSICYIAPKGSSGARGRAAGFTAGKAKRECCSLGHLESESGCAALAWWCLRMSLLLRGGGMLRSALGDFVRRGQRLTWACLKPFGATGRGLYQKLRCFSRGQRWELSFEELIISNSFFGINASRQLPDHMFGHPDIKTAF